MEERFTTSADLSAGECLLACGIIGMLLICSLLAAASIHYGTAGECAAYVRLTLYLAVIALCCAALRATLTKEMSETAFVVSETDLVKVRPSRIVTVPIAEIGHFRYVRVPLLFNFGLLRFPGGSISISLRTRNLPGLIRSLRQSMARQGRAAVCNQKEIDDCTWAARCAEQSNARIRRFFPYFAGLTMLVCTVTTMTALFVWWFPFFLSFLWSVFGLLLFINGIKAAEYLISVPQKRSTAPPTSADVAAAYFIACGIAFVIYLASGIALRTAFLQ